MDWRYDLPIVAPIVDQTCTFQCLIPMGDLSRYDPHGHTSPSGYGPLGPCKFLVLKNNSLGLTMISTQIIS